MFKLLKVFALATPLLASGVVSVPSSPLESRNTTAAASPLHPALVTTSPVGNIAAVQSLSGDTRLYFQDSTGAITQYDVSNAFNTGTFKSNLAIVPANQVKRGSPIAATALVTNGYEQVHLFFLSPSNVLSEYIWPPAPSGPGPFQGGASCAACITKNGYVSVGTGDVLYAMENPSSNLLRVGFISAASPNTITEAINSGSGWELAVLN